MIVKSLGLVPYGACFEAMRTFTDEREADTPDEIWLCEHPSVFTLGLAGVQAHVLDSGDIPVVQSNRGGQVTYHGPGQLIAYPLLDLKRLGIYVKEYVYRLETALLQTIDVFGIVGHRVAGAPGIYVRLADPRAHGQHLGPHLDPFSGLGKVAALGIKVSQHRSYHGLALNVAMDLTPFSRINPCGYAGLRTVDLSTLGAQTTVTAVAPVLTDRLVAQFSTP